MATTRPAQPQPSSSEGRSIPQKLVVFCILSALVAHTGWHWMTERADQLSRYNFDWTTLTAAQLAGVTRWLMWLVIAAGVAWMVSAWLRRRAAGAA